MFKIACFLALVAAVSAGNLAVAPAVAALPAPFVTARSSQSIARNYNTLAAAPLAYSAPLAYTAPVAAVPAAPIAYSAPAIAPGFAPLAYSAPAIAAAGPFAYAAAPGLAPYAAAPLLLKR